MVRTELLTPELKFLEIPKQKWTGIIEATNCASVEELARFSTSSQNSIFDSDDPKLSYTSHENLLSVGSKRKILRDTATSGPNRSDGSELMEIEDCRMAPPTTTEIDARPLALCDASTTWMLCSWETLCVSLLICVLMCACVRLRMFL